MPRSPRIEVEGATHHVMARGNRGEPIVFSFAAAHAAGVMSGILWLVIEGGASQDIFDIGLAVESSVNEDFYSLVGKGKQQGIRIQLFSFKSNM